MTIMWKAIRYMKVKITGIPEFFRRIWLFSANKIKSSESEQPTQLVGELISSFWQKLGTLKFSIALKNAHETVYYKKEK